jgi:hypothetical protein
VIGQENAMPYFTFCLVALLHTIVSGAETLPVFDGGQPIPPRKDVPFVTANDNWSTFTILIWQYKTRAENDLSLYRKAGFKGFHIDRGEGQQKRVAFARKNQLPYYVDHAAGKGILHLHQKSDRDAISRKHHPVARPHSLANPATVDQLKSLMSRNIAVTKDGPVVAYAFDDEISTGIFNSPNEVDASKFAITAYRVDLKKQYDSIDRLNAAWGTTHKNFDQIGPVSFEAVRQRVKIPLLKMNLAPWIAWRAFNDKLFADTLALLSHHANTIDPKTPAGFVGGQQPSAYGGYDYAKLGSAVQWMEAYDIGGTNEILRSLWRYPNARPRVQTWFSTGNTQHDSWFLWYYLLHGNRGVIAWPDRNGKPWFDNGKLAPHIEANAKTFKEVQGPISKTILDPQAQFKTDPIAIFLSQPSIRANWAMDVTVHGRTWPNRSSSLDNRCQSAGKNRVAWFKLLEDLGYQYNVMTGPQVEAGDLVRSGYRVLILNRAIAISDRQAAEIRRFVSAGGTVIADHLCGLLDENGRGRGKAGVLDDLFGLQRDESSGYFNGKMLAEVNGEKYNKPFLERLDAYQGARRTPDGLLIVERGTQPSTSPISKGRTHYLNLSPVAYWDTTKRTGPLGAAWRKLIGGLLTSAGLRPEAQVMTDGKPIPLAEIIRWQRGKRTVVGVIRNPTRQGSITGLGAIGGIDGPPTPIEIRFNHSMKNIVDLRTGQTKPNGKIIRVTWNPWEAALVEFDTP